MRRTTQKTTIRGGDAGLLVKIALYNEVVRRMRLDIDKSPRLIQLTKLYRSIADTYAELRAQGRPRLPKLPRGVTVLLTPNLDPLEKWALGALGKLSGKRGAA